MVARYLRLELSSSTMFTRPSYLVVLALFAGICVALWIGITGPDLGWVSLHPQSYAAHVLAQAPLFMPEACDEHGRTTPENRAWHLLAHDPAGRFWFQRLSQNARGPARVYAILGLRQRAPDLYQRFRGAWEADTTTFQLFRSFGDPVVRMSVGNAVADTARHRGWAAALDAATTASDRCAA
jgi:hypothetical protein